MASLVIVLSFFVGLGFFVKMVYNAIKRKPNKRVAYGWLACTVVMVIAIFNSPPTPEQVKQSKIEAQKQAKAKAEEDAKAKAEAQKKAQEEAKAKAEEQAKKDRENRFAKDAAYLKQAYAGIADVHMESDSGVFLVDYMNEAMITGLVQEGQIGNQVAISMLKNIGAIALHASANISPDFKIRVLQGHYSSWTGQYQYVFETQAGHYNQAIIK